MKRLILAAVMAVALAASVIASAKADSWSIQNDEFNTRWLSDKGEAMPLGETSGTTITFSTLATALTQFSVAQKSGYIVRASYVTGSSGAGSQGSTANLVSFYLKGVSSGQTDTNFYRVTGLEFRIRPLTATGTSAMMDAINVAGQKYDVSTKVFKGQVIAINTGGGVTGATPTVIQITIE